MAGRQTLDLLVGVRILSPQPVKYREQGSGVRGWLKKNIPNPKPLITIFL